MNPTNPLCSQDPNHGEAFFLVGWGRRPLARTCLPCTVEVRRIVRIYKAVTINGTLVKESSLSIEPLNDD